MPASTLHGRFVWHELMTTDPDGAVRFYPGGGDEAALGDFSWHELATADYRAAWEFYRTLFGWEYRELFDIGAGGVYWMFGRVGAGPTLGGMYNKPPETPAPPHWLCYVRVPSADKAAAAVARLGGGVVNGPMEVPGGDRIAQCVDPQGAAFAVHSVTVAKPAAQRKPAKAKPKKKVKAKSAKQARRAKRRR